MYYGDRIVIKVVPFEDNINSWLVCKLAPNILQHQIDIFTYSIGRHRCTRRGCWSRLLPSQRRITMSPFRWLVAAILDGRFKAFLIPRASFSEWPNPWPGPRYPLHR